MAFNYTAFRQSILNIENSGQARYGALGPLVSSGSFAGQRATGAFQVMPGNIPSWTSKYYGQSLSASEFRSNPAAQEAVMQGWANDAYARRNGDVGLMARDYFGWGKSDGYTSGQTYMDRVRKDYARYSGQPDNFNPQNTPNDPKAGAPGYDPALGGKPGMGTMGDPAQPYAGEGGQLPNSSPNFKTTAMDDLYKSGTITPSPTVPRAIDQQTKVMSETEKKTEEARAKAEAKRQKEATTKQDTWYNILLMRLSDGATRLVFIAAGMFIMWAAVHYLGLGRTITQAIKPPRSI